MTASYKATSQGQMNSGTSHVLTLPTGLAVGDWLVAAGCGGNATPIYDWSATGLTILVASAAFGTGRWILGYKAVTAADIAAGSWTVAANASQYGVYGMVAYSNCAGFGTAGTATYRAASAATTTALAATLTAGQRCVVIRVEKSTNNPGPAVAAPAVTTRMSRYPNNTSWPSLVMAEYVAPAADVVFTDPIATANGVGIQIPILDAVVADASIGTVSVWDGTTEITGCVASYWDGTTEVPLGSAPGASKVAVWDGVTENPI